MRGEEHDGNGSIPVHTGKPGRNGHRATRNEVYPRTHGETGIGIDVGLLDGGLSPYTRGNHSNRKDQAVVNGSIPVHTGKPLDTCHNGNVH